MSSHLSRTKFEWNLFPMPKWMFFINALLILWAVTLAKTIDPIYWDKNNATFSSIGGQNITVEINDLIDIRCPIAENTTEGRPLAQYHKFTQVSLSGYRQCSLEGGRVRHMLYCNRPFVENKLTLLFQLHTPYPGGAIFTHGRDYYFITTSDGTQSGIDNTIGGLCASHNMKLRISVKPKPTVPPTTGSAANSTSNAPSPTTSDETTPTTTQTTTRPTTTMSTSTSTTTLQSSTTTAASTTKEDNKISSGRGGSAGQHRVSASLLLISSLVAVVRWLRP